MKDILMEGATIFMGFFAIMNPIANVPIFLGLTAGDDQETVRAIAFRSLMLAFIIVLVFAITGKLIFAMFGITLAAFRITGGLLVLLIGFHMLQGNHSSVHHPSARDKKHAREAELSIAVSPLAMPILAGPGTITTAMNYAAGGMVDMVITIAMFGLLCIITYLFFVFGERFVTFIGNNALGVITRMMGLILAVIGTQMLIEGIHGAFKI